MKYLGIDFGTKKIGLAVSDALGSIAFPLEIIPADNNLMEVFAQIVAEKEIHAFVVGDSLHMDGSDNQLQQRIRAFVSQLEKRFDLPVYMQDERMSSLAARSHLYGKGNIANERWSGKENTKKRSAVDAGAAAIILQRYLDTH